MVEEVKFPKECPSCGDERFWLMTRYIGCDYRAVAKTEGNKIFVEFDTQSDEVEQETEYAFGCGSCEWSMPVEVGTVSIEDQLVS